MKERNVTGSARVIQKTMKINSIQDSLREITKFDMIQRVGEGFLRRDVSKVSETGLHLVDLEKGQVGNDVEIPVR